MPVLRTIAALRPDPLAPAWVILPIAVLTMLVLAGHLLALARLDMPPSRRRIRRVNAALMLCTVPLLAYGFCLASPADQRVFVMVWTLGIAMVVIILWLAMVDMLNTWRLARAERRGLDGEFRSGPDALANALAELRDRTATTPDAGPGKDRSA